MKKKKKSGCLPIAAFSAVFFIGILIILLSIAVGSSEKGMATTQKAKATTKATTESTTQATTEATTQATTEATTQATTQATTATTQAAPQVTMGQRNALASAKSYLNYSGFSQQGLWDQLAFEGYDEADIGYAIDNCGADWDAEAVESARNYLAYSSFSKEELIHQLEYEGFTTEQAQYGADVAYQ